MDISSTLQRVVRAMSFDTRFFQELRVNTGLTREALLIVIVVAVLSAFGGLGGGFTGFLVAGIMAVLGYYIWSYVALWVAKQFYGVTVDISAVQRAIGYAYAPRVLSFLAWVPCIGWIVAFVGMLWSLALGVFALREIMGLDTTKAIVVTVVGWVIIFVITLVLGLIFGGSVAAANVMGF
jgi:hypothetical protein